MVTNSNWQGADHLATCICKRGRGVELGAGRGVELGAGRGVELGAGRGVELGATKNKLPQTFGAGLEPRTFGC